jgi:hypothetical protein
VTEKPATKVYLDSDVVIQGGRRPEHLALKEFAISGVVDLYWSPTVQHEQKARSIVAHKTFLPTDPSAAAKAVRHRRQLDQSEADERNWWRPATLHVAKCTFEGLILTAPLITLFGDPTGELALLTDLLDNHRVKRQDAMHLMIGHSARVDSLLTWDTRLIRKAARVHWLHPRVETPAAFIASLPPR